MLANPTSTKPADMARRTAVRDRIKAFNTRLKAICEDKAPKCKFDNEAVFAYPFSLSHLSTWDYFHPNTAGQTVLADVTYKAGFTWQGQP